MLTGAVDEEEEEEEEGEVGLRAEEADEGCKGRYYEEEGEREEVLQAEEFPVTELSLLREGPQAWVAQGYNLFSLSNCFCLFLGLG